jgi:hypothetical protein
MNEHSFRKSFEREMKLSLSWHWKIHDQFAGGVPDAYYEGTKKDLWVEYKWLKMPKRDSTLVDFSNPDRYLSKLQQLWIARRHANRGDTAVVIGHEGGCIAFLDLDWQKPFSVAELNDRTMTKKALCVLIADQIN